MDQKPATSNTKERFLKTNSYTFYLLCFTLYIAGIITFLFIIADPFTMSTYFSDNSLLPGLVNREFSLATEAEYYLKDLNKFSGLSSNELNGLTLSTSPKVVNYIKHELDNIGLQVYEQHFNFNGEVQFNGTNLYSIIRGERSASSEAITLCVPYKVTSNSNTLPGVALSLAMAKYFATKSYWAKDVIILFVDHDHYGTSAWLDSYYDVNFRSDLKRMDNNNKDGIYYESLPERSGPMQAAIILEMYGRKFTRVNVKIQGLYGQLPNLDLFNLVIELAARESITPYFHDKSLPFDLSAEDLYRHHFETAISFMKTQATMQANGLHGLFLRYAVQSLTLECPEHKETNNKSQILASLLNLGRLVEGIFRSLNNLTERFNRSYYFYIILSLRRFTSIGYYMIAFGLMVAPILIKPLNLYLENDRNNYIGARSIIILTFALILSLISTINISLAMMSALVTVPILILI